MGSTGIYTGPMGGLPPDPCTGLEDDYIKSVDFLGSPAKPTYSPNGCH